MPKYWMSRRGTQHYVEWFRYRVACSLESTHHTEMQVHFRILQLTSGDLEGSSPFVPSKQALMELWILSFHLTLTSHEDLYPGRASSCLRFYPVTSAIVDCCHTT